LVSLCVSVSLMVGFVLPWLTRVFRGWLHPPAGAQAWDAKAQLDGRRSESSS
jgi:antibiotic biosynthesis monooxygenase (ABM) superfamily enzyme